MIRRRLKNLFARPSDPWDRLRRPQVHMIRFLLKHLFFGLVAAWTLAALILVFDVGGIGTLLFRSPDWPIWLFLLVFGLSVTLGGVAMGVGIMSLGQERD